MEATEKMQAQGTVPKLAIILTTLALVLVPMSAVASHNSVGAGVQVVQADEYDQNGDLAPDIDDVGAGGNDYQQIFHQNVDPARLAPSDQTGQNYTDCDTFADAKDGGDAEDGEYNPSVDGTDCYVGYFDQQLEYVILNTLFITRSDSDPLYAANPPQDDRTCRGQDEDGNPGDHPGPDADVAQVDEALARVNDTQSDECNSKTHQWFAPPFETLRVDTDLLEGPAMGDDRFDRDGNGVSDVAGNQEGSGTLTFPFTAQKYYFLFGQPHQETLDADAESPYRAGCGPFGDVDAPPCVGPDEVRSFGTPLTDLGELGGPDACGDRTDECRLLTPKDLEHYDSEDNVPEGVSSLGRLCAFLPQFFTVNPGTLVESPCGAFGDRVDQFLPSAYQGGFGTGQAPTWAVTLPGWHGNAWLLNHQSSSFAHDFWCDGGSACHDLFADDVDKDGDGEKESNLADGTIMLAAVNPKVPSVDSDFWCVRPNILGVGGYGDINGDGVINETDDAADGTVDGIVEPDYVTAAFDADLFTHALQEPFYDAYRDEHVEGVPSVHDAFRTVARPILGDGFVGSPETLNNPLAPADDEEIEARLAELVPAAAEAIQQADYTEADNDDPEASHNDADYGEDGAVDRDQATNLHPFTRERTAGLKCTASGAVEQVPDATQEGGLRLDAQLSQTTVAVKDSTILDGLLPANEEDTHRGAWQLDLYSISGPATSVIDTNNNSAFDDCVEALGQPQPTRDACPWKMLWDAGNLDGCTMEDAQPSNPDMPCSTKLAEFGYAVNHTQDVDEDGVPDVSSDEAVGVGLYSVLKVRGPLLVTDVGETDQQLLQDRTTLMGVPGTGQQNCVIGLSKGFADHLADHIGDQRDNPANDTWGDDDIEDLCGTSDNARTYVIFDAFSDQAGDDKGDFNSLIDFAPLVPTPQGVRSSLADFGAEDEVCVGAVFSVPDDRTEPTSDTASSVALTDDAHYLDCDSLASTA